MRSQPPALMRCVRCGWRSSEQDWQVAMTKLAAHLERCPNRDVPLDQCEMVNEPRA